MNRPTTSPDPARAPARDVRGLAKANLHLHLTGAMRPATLAELAARRGVAVPPPLPRAVGTWADFQGRYDAARQAIGTPEDVRRVVVEAAEDDARDGCGWLELQVDPTSYAPALGGLRAAVEAVLAGAREAPIPTGVIVASSWTRPPEHAERLARLAAEYAGQGVVGFGLSNDERNATVADFAPAFRVARDAGLVATPHSGFYTGAEHVLDCVRYLGANRIGHGTAAAADPAALELLARRQVVLELCPTSYPPFGVHELATIPLRTLVDAGVPVAVATDDPLLFGTGLVGQYTICREVLGLDDHQLAALAAGSIHGSAAPEAVRRDLLAAVDRWSRDSPG
ncbi:adenosine deaminase [Actinophytocola xanthii]|uniref:Adenosine deaminase n=1 Tax=Actinophytocola xanthii TaxID=1912961 RepID=A0A1Q8CWM5_9PSEU|nr:adenosine deaminase [Actinophytocola xanthii]OLF18749.1 adenosine deaminase [Actinophytocola xanthii]